MQGLEVAEMTKGCIHIQFQELDLDKRLFNAANSHGTSGLLDGICRARVSFLCSKSLSSAMTPGPSCTPHF